MPEKRSDVLLSLDTTAQRQAKALVRMARHAALGTIDRESGAPSVSRVALATFPSGEPGFFISALAAHQGNLMSDARCSLLVGEPGKGDPLAHPRMTLIGTAIRLADGPEKDGFRSRYRNKNAKSKLYEDLPDFSYWKFRPAKISLNAGFGKAYALEAADLLTSVAGDHDWYAAEVRYIEHVNHKHPAVADSCAAKVGGSGNGWQLACVDPEGLDIVRGDEVLRFWFDQPLASARDLQLRLLN